MGLRKIADANDEADFANVESRDDYYTISEMARSFDVSLRTLRFYEHRGLVHPLRSAQSRLYSARDRVRLQMILRGRQLGFTLMEIRERLIDIGDSASEFEQTLALDQIQSQIDLLQRQREELDQAIDALDVTRRRMTQTSQLADVDESLSVACTG